MLLTFIVQRLSHCNVGKLDLLQNFLLDERSLLRISQGWIFDEG